MNTVKIRKRIRARPRRARNPFACDPVRVGGNLMHPIATTVDDRVRMTSALLSTQSTALPMPAEKPLRAIGGSKT